LGGEVDSADASIVERNLGYLLDFAGAFGGNLEGSNLERRYSWDHSPPVFKEHFQIKYMATQLNTSTKAPQPEKVISIYCPSCKGLMIRNYPYSPVAFPPEWSDMKKFPICKLCQYKRNKKALKK